MSENVAAPYPSLLRTVLGDVVEVVAADDDGVGHFGRVDDTGEDTATDGDVAGEGALLVDVGAVDSLCERVSAGTLWVSARGYIPAR